MDSKKSSFGNYTSKKNKKEELSIIPHWESSSSSSDFRFDRLQPSDQELGTDRKRLEFGHYVARQAFLDEEFWVYYISSSSSFSFFDTTFFFFLLGTNFVEKKNLHLLCIFLKFFYFYYYAVDSGMAKSRESLGK